MANGYPVEEGSAFQVSGALGILHPPTGDLEYIALGRSEQTEEERDGVLVGSESDMRNGRTRRASQITSCRANCARNMPCSTWRQSD